MHDHTAEDRERAQNHARAIESRIVTPPTDEARAPEQTVEPRTEAGRDAMLFLQTDVWRHSILAIEREAAAVAAPPLPSVDDLAVAIAHSSVGFCSEDHDTEDVATEIIGWLSDSQPSPDDR